MVDALERSLSLSLGAQLRHSRCDFALPESESLRNLSDLVAGGELERDLAQRRARREAQSLGVDPDVRPAEHRVRAYLTAQDNGGTAVAYYCPACAAREFGN